MNGPAVTTRDLEILRSLEDHRSLTTEQIERLHFPSAQTARRRLRQLERAGLVRNFRTAALEHRMTTLTPRGVALLNGGPSEDTVRLATGPRSPLFLAHLAGVNDFRIALLHACRTTPDVECLGFISEFETISDGAARRPQAYIADVSEDGLYPIRHIPDGVFGLRRQDRGALFFLEIDRGTEVVGRPERGVSKIIAFYLAYLTSGRFTRYSKDFGMPFDGFRLLLVTTSRRRVASIRERCGNIPFQPEKAKRFLWTTDAEVLQSQNLFEHPWLSFDPRDEAEYRIVSRRE